MGKRTIVETLWFNQRGNPRTIGIVQIRDRLTGERKAYIGSAPGNDAEADAMHIVESGARFKLKQINYVFSPPDP